MTGCCAVGCSNSSKKGFKLYSIPTGKSAERGKIWLSRIRRKNFQPSKNTALCSAHFEADQFEPLVPGKLRPNAVPTIFSYKVFPKPEQMYPLKEARKDTEPTPVKHDHAYTSREDYLSSGEDDAHLSSVENDASHSSIENDTPASSRKNGTSYDSAESDCFHIVSSVVQPNDLAQSLNPEVKKLKAELLVLKRKVKKAESEKNNLEQKISSIFNKDQILFLQKNGNVVQWSDETVDKAMDLRFTCGIRGYNTLLEQGYPFPSERTLRRRLKDVIFDDEECFPESAVFGSKS